jgi:hypothetical protein
VLCRRHKPKTESYHNSLRTVGYLA